MRAPTFTGELMLRWEQTEFLLKGLYLGLLVLVAWQIPTQAELGAVGLYTAGGLVLCLAAAAVLKFREGYRVHGKPLGFLLFLILENPGLVYMGLLIGLAIGTGMTFNQRSPPIDWEWDSVIPVAGGVVLVTEAGGVLTTVDGSPCDPFRPDSLASNGPLHPVLLKALRTGP